MSKQTARWARVRVDLKLECEDLSRTQPNSRELHRQQLDRVLACPVEERNLRLFMAKVCGHLPDLGLLSRELIVTENRGAYGQASDVVISVNGSPPKGQLWAILNASRSRGAGLVYARGSFGKIRDVSGVEFSTGECLTTGLGVVDSYLRLTQPARDSLTAALGTSPSSPPARERGWWRWWVFALNP